ncbi:hypothetical protein Pcinc_007362 [Petrolisthes cinctipes]|uniref:Uncharacterized protein n=1 Tax=Petrolisthes cinctipes TaxID=88211 RepID=A0AAE1KYN7_PETCI|nr:hypothetical protein Pcinc_007362 [Petrolisthes cinctipes]
MVIITVQDACAFVKDDVTEAQLDQLSRDELVVLAEYLGFYDLADLNKFPLQNKFETIKPRENETASTKQNFTREFECFQADASVKINKIFPVKLYRATGAFHAGTVDAICDAGEKSTVEDEASLDLNVLFDLPDGTIHLNNKELQGARQLTNLQRKDPECSRLMEKSVSEEESKKELKECFFTRGDILYRRWKPSDLPADDGAWKFLTGVDLCSIHPALQVSPQIKVKWS